MSRDKGQAREKTQSIGNGTCSGFSLIYDRCDLPPSPALFRPFASSHQPATHLYRPASRPRHPGKAVHLHTTYPIVLPLSCLAWPARTSAPPNTRHYPSNRLIDRRCNRTALQFGLSAARIKHDSPASHQEEEVCRLHGQSLRLASALSRPRTKLLYIGSQPHSAGLRLVCLRLSLRSAQSSAQASESDVYLDACA